MVVAPWAWVLCGLFIGGAFLAAVVQCREVLGRAAWPLWGTALAWPIGLPLYAVLNAAGLGPVDEYGDRPAAGALAFSVTAGVLVIGLVALGGWLAMERTGSTRYFALA